MDAACGENRSESCDVPLGFDDARDTCGAVVCDSRPNDRCAPGASPVSFAPKRRIEPMKEEANRPVRTVKLGATGPDVFALGLGCMGMSGVYGPTDEAESIATVQAAIERGVTLLDTGDFYGMGHNEMLVGRAIA